MKKAMTTKEYSHFLQTLKYRIGTARQQALHLVNKELILMYHTIGTELLNKIEHSSFDSNILLYYVSLHIKKEYPLLKNFDVASINYMIRFAQTYPDTIFIQGPLARLSWQHHMTILDKIHDPIERFFYIHRAIEEQWSVHELVFHIDYNLFSQKGIDLIDLCNNSVLFQPSWKDKVIMHDDIINFLESADQPPSEFRFQQPHELDVK
jgi:predicted nuclease of restriction endonuclease-like (RecB) superfamily